MGRGVCSGCAANRTKASAAGGAGIAVLVV